MEVKWKRRSGNDVEVITEKCGNTFLTFEEKQEMRKFLLGLFALALVAAFTAPAYAAADFRFSGIFRVRGYTSDNTDRNDDRHDGAQAVDALSRPRFTATTDGGKIVVLWEPEWNSPNSGFDTAGRQDVGTNRWVVDFAVPGSALRIRWGRTDYVSPDKEIFDSFGRSRNPGFAIYGKITPNVSLSLFNTVRANGTGVGITTTQEAATFSLLPERDDPTTPNVRGGVVERTVTDENDDVDNYLGALAFKVSPNMTLTPWVANSRDSSSDGYDYWFYGLHAKAKMGIVNINASGIFQSGEVSNNVDLSAWGFLLRTSATFGKLKLMGNVTLFSGDEDDLSFGRRTSEQGEPSASHRSLQPDGDLERFTFPSLGGVGWVTGGHLMTSRRWTTLGNSLRNQTLTGNGSNTQLNGATVFEGLFEYQVSKTFKIGGGVSFYDSAESAPDIIYTECSQIGIDGRCVDNTDGDTEKRIRHDSDTYFGTEFNLGFRWKIYPKLELRAVGAYMVAGDYGKVAGDNDFDDPWVLAYSLRHTF